MDSYNNQEYFAQQNDDYSYAAMIHHSEQDSQDVTNPAVHKSNRTKPAYGRSSQKVPRIRFTQKASERLFSLFNAGVNKPNKQLREELAKELGKTPRSIQIWFQNKRAKSKQVYLKRKSDVDVDIDEEVGEEEVSSSLKRNHSLSLNTDLLSADFSSPYSVAYNGRNLSADPSQRKNSVYLSPLLSSRSAGLGGMYPTNQSTFGEIMKSHADQSTYPSPQEMQYGRIIRPFPVSFVEKIETSQLPSHNTSFPHSAVELRSASIPSLTTESRPYGDGPPSTAFPYDNNGGGFNFESINQSDVSVRRKFSKTLPDLHEITSDPSKFMEWLNTSN